MPAQGMQAPPLESISASCECRSQDDPLIPTRRVSRSFSLSLRLDIPECHTVSSDTEDSVTMLLRVQVVSGGPKHDPNAAFASLAATLDIGIDHAASQTALGHARFYAERPTKTIPLPTQPVCAATLTGCNTCPMHSTRLAEAHAIPFRRPRFHHNALALGQTLCAPEPLPSAFETL